jgi:hypothetical protein
MHAVQAAFNQSPLDGPAPKPVFQELPEGHDSVLATGEFGYLPVTWM